MTKQTFSTWEIASLTVAIMLHIGLFAALWFLQDDPEPVPRIERVSVSLAEDVGLQAAAPDPVAESRASTAPTLSDNPMPAAAFEPVQPLPAPRPVATTQPRPVATTQPRPTATRAPRPRPTPTATRAPRPRPTSTAPRRRPDRPASQPTTAARSGGSRLSENFLEGAGSSTATSETRIPASQIGTSAKASLLQAITREIRPHWDAPNGLDAELLVTPVSWRLNENGSLSGTPRCGTTRGVNAANRTQAERHCELAIRAIRLASPFDLPDQYYNAWKSVSGFEFSGEL